MLNHLSQRLQLITLSETLIVLDITKTKSNSCFIIHGLIEEKLIRTKTASRGTRFDIALLNHALCAQPTD